jgi:sugar lactone lactonase YvrE
MTKLLFATLLAVSALVAILVGAPGLAGADETIYWTNRYDDKIAMTNLTSGTSTFIENPTMGTGDPDSLIFDTKGNIIYGLTNARWSSPYAQIRSFNPVTKADTMITSSFSTDLRDLALDPGGKSVLVSDVDNGKVWRVVLDTGVRTKLADFVSSPGGIAYDASGRLLVNVDKTVYQLDPATGSILHSASAGQFMDGLTYDPYSGKFYAAGVSGLIPIAFDSSGKLVVGTQLGSFGSSSNLDGVESDGKGNIIVADIGDGINGRVWMYNIDKDQTTWLFNAEGVDDIAPIVGGGSPPGSSVPAPATVLLLGPALVGLAAIRRRFKK